MATTDPCGFRRGDVIEQVGGQRFVYWGESRGFVGLLRQIPPLDDLTNYEIGLAPVSSFMQLIAHPNTKLTQRWKDEPRNTRAETEATGTSSSSAPGPSNSVPPREAQSDGAGSVE